MTTSSITSQHAAMRNGLGRYLSFMTTFKLHGVTRVCDSVTFRRLVPPLIVLQSTHNNTNSYVEIDFRPSQEEQVVGACTTVFAREKPVLGPEGRVNGHTFRKL